MNLKNNQKLPKSLSKQWYIICLSGTGTGPGGHSLLKDTHTCKNITFPILWMLVVTKPFGIYLTLELSRNFENSHALQPNLSSICVTIHCVSVLSFPVMFSVLRMICTRISCSDMRNDMRDDMCSGEWYVHQEMTYIIEYFSSKVLSVHDLCL